MPPTQPQDPFAHDPDDVPLDAPPLVRVVAQVRHPKLTALAGDHGEKNALRFAEAVETEYPVFDETQDTNLVLTPDGAQMRPGANKNWRLKSADENWQVSFGQDFMAIDTDSYSTRSDFLARLNHVVRLYAELVKPTAASRIGVRYTNRIDDAHLLGRLPQLVRPEVLGPFYQGREGGSQLIHSFTQSQYKIGDFGVITNWGIAPPNALVDPTLKPSVNKSWILDVDAFTASRREFSPGIIDADIRELTVYCYKLFRWAVTDEFLMEFREGS